MKLVVVMPATHGREGNVEQALKALAAQQDVTPPWTILIDDGGELDTNGRWGRSEVVRVTKHEPGKEQPRNVGVRYAEMYGATHVWFVDSDVVVVPEAMGEILRCLSENPHRVLICPYDWLGPGLRPEDQADFWLRARGSRNDPRWAMFDERAHETVLDDLSVGLGCFSGNLVWPIEEFKRVGGFWSEIHHGRCEDGELGLRAVSMQVPLGFCAGARGFHLHHPVNHELIVERNRRDVPMLNDRHPWVERGAVYLSDRDGAAFDVKCACGEMVPTGAWWEHAAACPATTMILRVSRG